MQKPRLLVILDCQLFDRKKIKKSSAFLDPLLRALVKHMSTGPDLTEGQILLKDMSAPDSRKKL